MRLLVARVLLAISVALVAAACTKPSATHTDGPAGVCVKEQQQCVYAEGKIGLCTANPAMSPTACDGGPCLVCMSLH